MAVRNENGQRTGSSRGNDGIQMMNIGRTPTSRQSSSPMVNVTPDRGQQMTARGQQPAAGRSRIQSGRNLDVRLNTEMMGNRSDAPANGSGRRAEVRPERRTAREAVRRSVPSGSSGNGRTGNSTGRSSDPRARARAKARRRRKQQRRMLMVAAGAAAVLILAAAAIGFYNVNQSKKMDAFRDAGITAMQSGDYAGAVQNFDEAMKLAGKKIGSNEIDILQRRAESAYSMQDYAGSLETWKTLMENNPDNADYKKNAVLCMLETGQYEEALQLGQMQGRIYNKMALEKIQAGDYEGALVLIEQGLNVDDGSAKADLLYNQAVAHENRGNYAQALELFRQYVGTYGMDENVQKEIEFLQTRVGGSASEETAANPAEGETAPAN